MRVGFMGLGYMGTAIARRLARNGFDVIGYDVVPAAMEAFDEPGARWDADPIAVARQVEALGICVRTDEHLETLAGDGALFDALPDGGIIILHSTVSPDLARRLARMARETKLDFIDVGVSGGPPGALEGRLSLFVGGDDAAVARMRPWLEAIGKPTHLGPVGRGLEGKLINNLITIAYYGMSAAILDVADSLGFDRATLVPALMAGSAHAFALEAVGGLVGPRAPDNRTPAYDFLYGTLKKDVDHARNLSTPEYAAMNALLSSCETLLNRLKRSAADYGPDGKGV